MSPKGGIPALASMTVVKYRVVFEKSVANWAAYVPDLPGVITTGKTKKDTQRLIREAIAFHLEGLREDNLLMPPPLRSRKL